MSDLREAVVLAGGFGTRLAHLVPDVCKPMALVAGRPFLRFILDQLASAGFEHVVIANGYRGEQIERFFGDSYRGVRIEYSRETSPLQTGGAARSALERCSAERVFVLNGDSYFDVDFDAMEGNGVDSNGVVVAVASSEKGGRYGGIALGGYHASDGLMRIQSFREKAGDDTGFINGGVYLLPRDLLGAMPPSFSLEQDFFEEYVSRGTVRAAVMSGMFIDIGVPEDFRRAQTLLDPLVVPWKLAMFDRDGTINVDTGHLVSEEGLRLVPQTISTMRRYSESASYKVVVITNQAGIAKGLYSESEMRAFHKVLAKRLQHLGVRIDAFYYCPHHPAYTGPCHCRKPEPGLLESAIEEFDARASDCVMYGDQDTDQQAADSAGVAFRKVGSPENRTVR